MKRLILAFTGLTFLFGCNNEPEECPGSDSTYCQNAKDNLLDGTYHGIFRICNAEPEMTNYTGEATVTSTGGDGVAIHLITDTLTFQQTPADTTYLDTTLYYTVQCCVQEDTIPSISLFDSNNTDAGYYTSHDFISFSFIYGPCGHYAWFEGN